MSRLLLSVFVALLLIGCDLDGRQPPPESSFPDVVWSIPFTENYVTAVQPLIENERVYLALGPTVRCYELSSGDLCWKTRMLDRDQDIGGREILDSADRLFIHSGARVHSYMKSDGHLAWSTVVPNFTLTAFARAASTEQHIFLGGEGEIVRLRKSDGFVDLRIPVDTLQAEGVVQSVRNVRVQDGTLFAPTVYFRPSFGVIEGNAFAFDVDTGDLKWARRLPNPEVSSSGSEDSVRLDSGAYALAANENRVVVPAGQVVYAFEPSSGELVWERFFPDDGFSTAVRIEDDVAYVGGNSSTLYALNVESGDLRWKTETSGTLTTRFTLLDGWIYFCNELSGDIWILNLETGSVIHRGVPPRHGEQNSFNTFVSPLAVSEQYMVNVGGRKIFALTRPRPNTDP
ncbi:MAG: PQQ-binding-like beta-propeller repeat protein [Bacteroidetes bacterium]|jgi:outer membrane protein assembly factor BamB|nr:PQQ-binding-like beta-propeller repeat protein [Bacteroidota bacterium]